MNLRSPKQSDPFLNAGITSDPVRMLAPMEGITNALFREEILCRTGADIVATEFVRITGERQRVEHFHRHASTPLQIQLMSPQAMTLVRCIDYLFENETLRKDDWLDLNVGCPSKRVNSRGAGAALLKTPEVLVEIIKAVRSVHSGILSVKTRVGFESDENFSALLSVLADAPLDFITIHARTRCDGYTNPANWSYLKEATQRLPYPVIGNGDIFTALQAKTVVHQTGVRGVMCGRGVLMNPLLLRDIRDNCISPAPTERRAELVDFFFSLLNRYRTAEHAGRARYLGKMKELCVWFSRNPLIGKELFTAVKRCQTLEALSHEAFQFLSCPLPPGKNTEAVSAP